MDVRVGEMQAIIRRTHHKAGIQRNRPSTSGEVLPLKDPPQDCLLPLFAVVRLGPVCLRIPRIHCGSMHHLCPSFTICVFVAVFRPLAVIRPLSDVQANYCCQLWLHVLLVNSYQAPDMQV